LHRKEREQFDIDLLLQPERLVGMMTPQGLQIDSLARLGIIRNGIVIVNIVFRVCIADC
jgi:hypothetical protein